MNKDHLVPIALAVIVGLALFRACNAEDDPVPVPEPTPAVEATPAAEVAPVPPPGPTPEPTPAPPSRRLSVLGPGDLPTGPAAAAQPGDLALTSARGVRFIISALANKGAFQESGGNLIDIAVGDKEDVFDGMGSWLEATFPRQGRYTEQTLVHEGPSVVVTGVDSGNPLVAVATSWTLLSEGDDERVLGRLQITTTVTNASDETLTDYDLGDIVGWGGLTHFAPGPGFDLAGVKDETLPWVGGEARDHAAVLIGPGPLTGPHGSSWSDPIWSAPTIAPGASETYERQLLVGETLADLLPAVLAHTGGPTAELTIQVRHGAETMVAGATVDVLRVDPADGTRTPLIRCVTGPDGHVTTVVPPGQYRIVGSSSSRHSVSHSEIQLTAGASETVGVLVSGEGRVGLRATNVDGEDLAARFTFEGVGDTDDPDFGSTSWAIGGNRAHILEGTTLPLPPGRYIVTATHGPAWSLDSREVTISALAPGATAEAVSYEFTAHLDEVVPTAGWLQCDLHQHAAYSADSSVPPIDGLVASAAEGLNCVATTDHDAVADWTRHFARSGVGDDLLWLPGLEVTSETDGHFNAYPWDPALGAIDHAELSPAEIVAALRSKSDAIVQLNHPSWGQIGLWDVVGINPDTGLLRLVDDASEPTGLTYNYDAVEILNGKDIENATTALEEWLPMVDAGKGTAAIVGTSDSHRLVGQERGSARTWIRLDGAAPTADAVVAAIRERKDTTASTGPLLHIRGTSGAGLDPQIVVVLQAPTWMPIDEIELLGGDPAADGAWSVGTWTAGSPGLVERIEGELRTWELTTRVSAFGVDGWVVAVARSEAPMAPWSDAPAFAITSPVRVSAPE